MFSFSTFPRFVAFLTCPFLGSWPFSETWCVFYQVFFAVLKQILDKYTSKYQTNHKKYFTITMKAHIWYVNHLKMTNIIIILMTIINVTNHHPHHHHCDCHHYQTCDVLACSASILHLMFISVGRYRLKPSSWWQ